MKSDVSFMYEGNAFALLLETVVNKFWNFLCVEL